MSEWDTILVSSLTTFWHQLAAYTPRILGAFVLILLGWFISWLVSKSFHMIIKRLGFNKLCSHIGVTELMESIKLKSTPAQFISKIIFWIIFLLSITSVSTVLGLENVSTTIQSFVVFIPRILFALLIFIIGTALAKLASKVIENSLDSIGFSSASTIASMIQGLLVLLTGIIALEQMNIQTEFVYYVILIVLITIGLVIAISLGLGTRQLSQQIVSGFYARENIKPGDMIQLEKVKGEVVKIGSCMTEVLVKKNTITLIPNNKLIAKIVILDKVEK